MHAWSNNKKEGTLICLVSELNCDRNISCNMFRVGYEITLYGAHAQHATIHSQLFMTDVGGFDVVGAFHEVSCSIEPHSLSLGVPVVVPGEHVPNTICLARQRMSASAQRGICQPTEHNLILSYQQPTLCRPATVYSRKRTSFQCRWALLKTRCRCRRGSTHLC